MSSREFVSIMLNPFEDTTSRKLLIYGVLGFIVMSLLGYFFHFINNGIIQLHFSHPRPYWKYIVYGLINSGSLTVLMFAYAKFNYSKTRLLGCIDFSTYSPMRIGVYCPFSPESISYRHYGRINSRN